MSLSRLLLSHLYNKAVFPLPLINFFLMRVPGKQLIFVFGRGKIGKPRKNKTKHLESVLPCSYLLATLVSFLRVSRVFHFCGASTWHLIQLSHQDASHVRNFRNHLVRLFYFPDRKTEAQRGEITCLRTLSNRSAFSASFCIKGKLLRQISFFLGTTQ